MKSIGYKTAFYLLAAAVFTTISKAEDVSYAIVDTAQIRCYDNRTEIEYPARGNAFYGQDAQYRGNEPAYTDNGDGTITDKVTGLMWTKNPGGKKTYSQCKNDATKCRTGGYSDWRLPSIKELYSLILFSGTDPDPMAKNTSSLKAFIDTRYFNFSYGSEDEGDRIIDSQFATSTIYRSTTMGGNQTMFGVNFADGRIKGYPVNTDRREKKYYALYVRGNSKYGQNKYHDNGDGTITDLATGLTWMQLDSGHLKAGDKKDGKLNWEQALEWAENLEYAGHSDWRLPNAKELQSIIDYNRCPDTTGTAATDPVFKVTAIENEGSGKDYPFYWSSTTHAGDNSGEAAVYLAFGRALGWINERGSDKKVLQDVHGAGAQRSDPKSGNASKFPTGRGPQGDVIRIYNMVRCVRGGKADTTEKGPALEMTYRPGDRMPQQSGSFAEHFIKRLDKNGDGKVSKSEFDGPQRHFSTLDTDNSGYITASEAPAGPPPQQRR
jgi:hypothetical protein